MHISSWFSFKIMEYDFLSECGESVWKISYVWQKIDTLSLCFLTVNNSPEEICEIDPTIFFYLFKFSSHGNRAVTLEKGDWGFSWSL